MSGIRPGPLSSSQPVATSVKASARAGVQLHHPIIQCNRIELILTTPLAGAAKRNQTSVLGAPPHVGAGKLPEAVAPELVKFCTKQFSMTGRTIAPAQLSLVMGTGGGEHDIDNGEHTPECAQGSYQRYSSTKTRSRPV
ncbi:MAG: hypothetical protein IPI00_06530 [Flavobacteriales bacterium]|nr:hypothetical protein [Flavobacteriales bacterium]